MTNNILAILESGPIDTAPALMPETVYPAQNMFWPIVITYIPVILIFSLYIGGIVWVVRYLKRAAEERQRFRIELGRIGEELEQLRKQLERKKNDK